MDGGGNGKFKKLSRYQQFLPGKIRPCYTQRNKSQGEIRIIAALWECGTIMRFVS